MKRPNLPKRPAARISRTADVAGHISQIPSKENSTAAVAKTARSLRHGQKRLEKPASSTAAPRQPRRSSPREQTIPSVAQAKDNSTPLGRFFLLSLMAAAVFLVIFSPLRSWMIQQQQARDLAERITQVRAENQELEAEIKRYQDPEYLSRQARERLGYVKPGEITYVVLDSVATEDPPKSSGWKEKDSRDLPWFGIIAEGMRLASQPDA